MTFPIVLAHGLCRFDILWNETLKIDNNDDHNITNIASHIHSAQKHIIIKL